MIKVNWKSLHSKVNSRIQLARNTFYEVVWTHAFKDENTLGETRFDPKQIVIKKDQTDKESVKTYIHECLHAISAEYDVGLTETQVQKLEKALPYLLKPGNIFKE